jgi:hypothetical protein
MEREGLHGNGSLELRSAGSEAVWRQGDLVEERASAKPPGRFGEPGGGFVGLGQSVPGERGKVQSERYVCGRSMTFRPSLVLLLRWVVLEGSERCADLT